LNVKSKSESYLKISQELNSAYSNKIYHIVDGCSDTMEDIAYNDVTASSYEEFEVTKICRYKPKKDRILGIDMHNIYNIMPKHQNCSIIFIY
jgi:hypothetical protein